MPIRGVIYQKYSGKEGNPDKVVPRRREATKNVLVYSGRDRKRVFLVRERKRFPSLLEEQPQAAQILI